MKTKTHQGVIKFQNTNTATMKEKNQNRQTANHCGKSLLTTSHTHKSMVHIFNNNNKQKAWKVLFVTILSIRSPTTFHGTPTNKITLQRFSFASVCSLSKKNTVSVGWHSKEHCWNVLSTHCNNDDGGGGFRLLIIKRCQRCKEEWHSRYCQGLIVVALEIHFFG